MKSFRKYLILALAVVLGGFASCNKVDYPDRFASTDGKPTVDYIRYADKDLFIEQGYMNEVVCFVGSNLRSVKEVWFNDQQASLNTSYITDNTLLVSIPKNQPTKQTDMAYLIASADTVKVPFKVLPPSPAATSMSCEYAKPGTQATIYGEYFIDLEYVRFQGLDATVYVDDEALLTYDATAISLIIPEGAESGQVIVKTNSGESAAMFQYQDQRGLLFDFDGKTGLGNHGWHNMTITSGATDGISGEYLQLGDGSSALDGDGQWDDSHFSFEYWPGNWEDPETFTAPDGVLLTDLADFSSWSSMAYKFELCIPAENPWCGNAMQIIPGGVDMVSYGAAGAVSAIDGTILGGCNNTYISGNEVPRALYRPWNNADGSYDTDGKWITVTVPMSDFKYGYDGSTATGDLSPSSFTSLCLFVCGGGVSGTTSAPVLKIDNIRAVPIK